MPQVQLKIYVDNELAAKVRQAALIKFGNMRSMSLLVAEFIEAGLNPPSDTSKVDTCDICGCRWTVLPSEDKCEHVWQYQCDGSRTYRCTKCDKVVGHELCMRDPLQAAYCRPVTCPQCGVLLGLERKSEMIRREREYKNLLEIEGSIDCQIRRVSEMLEDLDSIFDDKYADDWTEDLKLSEEDRGEIYKAFEILEKILDERRELQDAIEEYRNNPTKENQEFLKSYRDD